MYPYVFFILFITVICKSSYASGLIGYIAKSVGLFLLKAFIGNVYVLTVFIQGAILDAYYSKWAGYYGAYV